MSLLIRFLHNLISTSMVALPNQNRAYQTVPQNFNMEQFRTEANISDVIGENINDVITASDSEVINDNINFVDSTAVKAFSHTGVQNSLDNNFSLVFNNWSVEEKKKFYDHVYHSLFTSTTAQPKVSSCTLEVITTYKVSTFYWFLVLINFNVTIEDAS